MKSILETGNKYFSVSVSTTKLSESSWLGRCRVRRRDTGELIDGFTIFEPSEAELKATLARRVDELINQLGQPSDWGNRDKVDAIVNRYVAFRESYADIFSTSGKEFSDEAVSAALQKVADLTTDTTIELTRAINALNDSELLRLVSASSDEYRSSKDPYVMDILRAKYILFDYIFDASSEVVAAHELHRQHLYPDSGSE